jgi:hypothetical protein
MTLKEVVGNSGIGIEIVSTRGNPETQIVIGI